MLDMDVLNYNIGGSSAAIARDKQKVSTMSIGGVANITSIRGYRDLNLISNMPRYGYSSSKKEFGGEGDAVGTLYSVPSKNAQMSHGGVKGFASITRQCGIPILHHINISTEPPGIIQGVLQSTMTHLSIF